MQNSNTRRNFIKNSAALFALSSIKASGLEGFSLGPVRRVALIGTGWYGKSDLFRLMQVAPTTVVGLCDVDKNQLQGAASLIAGRSASNANIPLYGDYRKMLAEQKPEIVLI